jgi:hypothetical protein
MALMASQCSMRSWEGVGDHTRRVFPRRREQFGYERSTIFSAHWTTRSLGSDAAETFSAHMKTSLNV